MPAPAGLQSPAAWAAELEVKPWKLAAAVAHQKWDREPELALTKTAFEKALAAVNAINLGGTKPPKEKSDA